MQYQAVSLRAKSTNHQPVIAQQNLKIGFASEQKQKQNLL
jgi:hypothetical protein